MTKQTFLDELRKGLSGLPQSDAEERIAFYSEMIDDRIEEGVPEEQAVEELGSPEALAASIIAETPLVRLVKERVRPRRGLAAWEIVLLVLGAPLWLSLLLALFAVLFSVYITLWAVALSFWAVFASLAFAAFVCVTAGIWLLIRGMAPNGLTAFSAALICAGLAVFAFFGCRWLTVGVARLTKAIALGIKHALIKKEAA